ncbi:MAG: 16S rRNA (adenine(1518)-N(6)/adenine(1519)-N(6))-dimethyltransferase RsmA [Cardiobacteriaceae bacterium]|nr:16S rRNA (adenine(1518)-N(6)/adenine(1519)-N(6))-dimethyltransferase RsmA [Cardiobacteriaceae bacterium]
MNRNNQTAISANKNLGQHFLVDEAVISQILAAFAPKKGEKIIEIGPGVGALTFPLSEKSDFLTLIELDSRAIEFLSERLNPNVKIIASDVLKVDFAQLGSDLRLIGNLPYNISSAILLHCLTYRAVIEDCVFMLQKELAERICAESGSRDYGRITVSLRQYFSADYLFTVPPEAFSPPPKVDSAIIYLRRREKSLWEIKNQENFQEILRLAFSMRRKMLRKSLAGIIKASELEELGILPTARPEELDGADFARIANYLAEKYYF